MRTSSPSTSSPPSPRRPSRPNAPSNGMPLQGASRFPICTRDPRAGSELSGKAEFGPPLPLGLAKLPSVQADRRGEVGARRCPAGTGRVFHTDDRRTYVREPNGRHLYEVKDRLKRLPCIKGRICHLWRKCEVLILTAQRLGLWQYISSPRGWPRANELGRPAAGTLRTGYREETEQVETPFIRCQQ